MAGGIWCSGVFLTRSRCDDSTAGRSARLAKCRFEAPESTVARSVISAPATVPRVTAGCSHLLSLCNSLSGSMSQVLLLPNVRYSRIEQVTTKSPRWPSRTSETSSSRASGTRRRQGHRRRRHAAPPPRAGLFTKVGPPYPKVESCGPCLNSWGAVNMANTIQGGAARRAFILPEVREFIHYCKTHLKQLWKVS